MKILNTMLAVSLVGLLATFVYQHRESGDIHFQPILGTPQTITAIRFIDGFPNGTQISTEQGEMYVERYLELSLQSQVVVRRGRDRRWLCLAPKDPSQDLRTLPCWQILSRAVESTP